MHRTWSTRPHPHTRTIPAQVQVWFQNRRQKERTKTTSGPKHTHSSSPVPRTASTTFAEPSSPPAKLESLPFQPESPPGESSESEDAHPLPAYNPKPAFTQWVQQAPTAGTLCPPPMPPPFQQLPCQTVVSCSNISFTLALITSLSSLASVTKPVID